MIIYRPHRSTLVEAMAEAKEFNTEQEMKEYIVTEWNSLWKQELFNIDDVVVHGDPVNDEMVGKTQGMCA